MKILNELLPGTLVPLDKVFPDFNLIESVKEYGVLVPITLCDGIVIDGHKRLKAARQANLHSLTVNEIKSEKIISFAVLNQHRKLEPLETAIVFSKLQNIARKTKFLSAANLSISPQMSEILEFIAQNLDSFHIENINQIPFNLWRELGHFENKTLISWIVNLPGTFANKRNLASLIKKAQRLGKTFSIDKLKDANEATEYFTSLIQPRLTDTKKKFAGAIKNINFPSGVKVKADKAFERPGLEFNIHVTRNSLDRFFRAKEIAQQLFDQVEEL
ncbi:MAG: hypothetical protein ACQETH_04010 [Candidatus Rifleibacteriota bacterium]